MSSKSWALFVASCLLPVVWAMQIFVEHEKATGTKTITLDVDFLIILI